MQQSRDVKWQDLPHPLDHFCARLRAARIRFRTTASDTGMTVSIVHPKKHWERATAIWLGTREEAPQCSS